jgi:geranylgeranyl transferase type-2 subunit alpha
MRKWPKCYWLWDHRMWLLHEATRHLDASVARRLWEEDMSLVSMMLVKDSRNFHGWSYRRIVVAELESPALKGSSMVESEFQYTTKMIKANLSNFSAWHNRSKLIPRLLDERNADDAARRKFLDDGVFSAFLELSTYTYQSLEFDIMKNALWVDSADQSLWFYYQFLLTTIISPAAHKIIVPGFTQADRIEYVDQQLLFLNDLLDGAEDSKWIYNALIDCTTALWEMKGDLSPTEARQNLKMWLDELRKLDPLRSGRWDELGGILGLED